MGPLAGDLKVLVELPQSGAGMTSEAEMSHQITSNIVSVESANVYLGNGLPAHARESIRGVGPNGR